MPDYRSRITLVVKVVAMGLVGALVGSIASCTGLVLPADYARRVIVYPLPHHFPKYPGGVTFRYAMAHDVIHERYTHHGKAYYAERNRRVLQALGANGESAAGKDVAPEAAEKHFALLDDLGAGYEALGRHNEAVSVLREKLRRQQARGDSGRKVYTTYANLGTFLIHGNFQKAVAGDKAAKERLREGLGFIHQAIAVNRQAHFGREAWQAVTVEFLLAVMDRPELLLKYDMAGDRLDREIKGTEDHPLDVTDRHEWSVNTGWHGLHWEHPESDSEASRWRERITRVGAERDWAKEVHSSHLEPVPFDEPVLGIIGMWRLGG